MPATARSGSSWTSACAAAPAPTSATSSSAPATRRTCPSCARSCCAPSTAATSRPRGRLFGKLAGARELTEDVIKEWFYYFYQCTECRRCSVFCPYGIDTGEITMMGRELLNLLGLNINWVVEPAANCFRTGNHLGIPPHAMKETLEFAVDELEGITGIRVDLPINKKGRGDPLRRPFGRLLREPPLVYPLGLLALFHEIGLDYTWSTYASEGGQLRPVPFLASLMKRLNAKIYAEAKRLGVKWILGGECGHMWRVLHQYMDTMNGPADFLEEPVSPITGTVFENARSTKMVHIAEFTADLIQHGKLKLDPRRNDHTASRSTTPATRPARWGFWRSRAIS